MFVQPFTSVVHSLTKILILYVGHGKYFKTKQEQEKAKKTRNEQIESKK
jgi:hypothetical protein